MAVYPFTSLYSSQAQTFNTKSTTMVKNTNTYIIICRVKDITKIDGDKILKLMKQINTSRPKRLSICLDKLCKYGTISICN